MALVDNLRPMVNRSCIVVWDLLVVRKDLDLVCCLESVWQDEWEMRVSQSRISKYYRLTKRMGLWL
jgi:hypothetical protein